MFQERKKEKKDDELLPAFARSLHIMKCNMRSRVQSLNVTLLRNSQMIVCSTTLHFSLLHETPSVLAFVAEDILF